MKQNKKPSWLNPTMYKKISFAQSGEDLIISSIFWALWTEKFTYLDIGAYHPFHFSNTAIFYQKGCRGINIEPDPTFYKLFLESRPLDINLNIGIGPEAGILDFYIMSKPTLNTFSEEEVKEFEKEGIKTKQTIRVRVETIQSVLQEYWDGKSPDFLTVDAEGLDYEILESIDFEKIRPTVICIETISYSRTGKGIKNNQIISYLKKKGYLLYADTNINSIFVDKKTWESKRARG